MRSCSGTAPRGRHRLLPPALAYVGTPPTCKSPEKRCRQKSSLPLEAALSSLWHKYGLRLGLGHPPRAPGKWPKSPTGPSFRRNCPLGRPVQGIPSPGRTLLPFFRIVFSMHKDRAAIWDRQPPDGEGGPAAALVDRGLRRSESRRGAGRVP